MATHQLHGDAASAAQLMAPWEGFLLSLVFLASGVATIYGLLAPALRIEQFWVFSRDVSILSAIRELIDSGQTVLGSVIFAVSVIVPLAKALIGFLVSSFARGSGPALAGVLGIFSALGKWSFTEVFILAIAVIVIDGQLLTAANLGPGIYAFATGAILSWVGTMGLHARAKGAL